MTGVGQGLNLWLAWAHVVLRIVHSLWSSLSNVILVRFSIFAAASLVRAALAVRVAMMVF